MPYFKYTTGPPENTMDGNRIHYYWEVPAGGIKSATAKPMDDNGNKGETSSSSSYKTKYEMLSHSLKSCLDYCALLLSLLRNNYVGMSLYKLGKERTVRLMVAEGLIEEKASGDDSSLEDVACSLMDELVRRGMLIQTFDSQNFTTCIEIPEPYYKLCVVERDEEDFVARSDHTPIRVSINRYYGTDISPHLKNLPIQSLFLSGGTIFSDQAIIDTICGLRSLLVLQWEGWADNHISFSKIGELINLKLLSLCVHSSIPSEITRSLSNFQHLQTLELSTGNNKVLEEVATIKTLRHLSCDAFQLPKGIGRLVNLQTLVRWDARSEVTDELSSLNQLRRLHVHQVADENTKKLLETITTMKKLVSLSLMAEPYRHEKYVDIFPLLEPFSPPPFLQEFHLVGTLMELPDWIASMENLTSLVLSGSYLTEDPSTIFQFLPNLKFLSLDRAYKAKFIGKEFCNEGGFPKLEILEIRSYFLVGWIEIVDGAFPSLTSFLCVSPELRIFPEGIQHVSKLQRLELVVHDDLKRRLNGDENYKIKHIPSVSMSSNRFAQLSL